jgi:hypothetical protein
MLCITTLAGCTTPAESIGGDRRLEYRSGKPVATVAACIRRNADETGAGMRSQTSTDLDGDPEVIVRKATDGSIVALVSIVPDKGTRVSVRVRQYSASPNSVADALVHDCL